MDIIIIAGGSGTTAGASNGKTVYVNRVEEIAGIADAGGEIPRYGGEIEPLETRTIRLESGQSVAKTYVKVGDKVKTGTKLFTYNRSSIEDAIEKNDIEIEKKKNEILTEQKSVEDERRTLQTLKTQAEISEATMNITEYENSIKSAEFELKKLEIERDRLNSNLANTDVYAGMDGVVRTINAAAASSSSSSDSDEYMTLMKDGDYRVKVKLNEQNINDVSEGEPMLIRSRTDETAVWTGVVTELDFSSGPSTDTNNSDYYDSSSDTMTSSSNYAFYVTLDNSEGLLLGEHVFVEPDLGQLTEREGLWIDSYYLFEEETETFLWAENRRHQLEKRAVTTGQTDKVQDQVEITGGLEYSDYIACPQSYYEEKMPVTRVDYAIDEGLEDDTEAGSYL